MSQYPYEQPEDEHPGMQQRAYGQQPQNYPYQQPPTPQYVYVQQPPVTVNVVQNAGGRPVVIRQGVNHTLHFWLTILTGGAWLFVWIPLAIKGKKTIIYR
ncbi:MAG TPA: hypothetical protein VGS97_18525 [Actinocrinis sp.]|uniref:hypothetical protein n=1 Tax=Actinocrinis sp. TaxID=1920516 RepID=UPI002DDCAC0A|nr:hypothetical protein [Actinocrinis sp.]HEV2346102.1 hypothetical protein [Actinocrinis sp.]